MYPYVCFLSLLAVTACTQMSLPTVTSKADPVQQMKTCLTTEALAQIQSGAAFATSVRATAKTIAKTCLNQLVPAVEQTSVIQTETQQQARQIITDLLNRATPVAD